MSQINRYDSNDGCEIADDGPYVLHSDHEAEVARLRAELNAATKAGLDAIAEICEKEREADALRLDAERYRWLRERANSDRTQICHYGTNWSWNLVTGEIADKTIDAAMGEGK